MRIEIDRDRFVETMQKQAEFGSTPGGGLHRLTLSDADRQVRDWFVDQLTELGLDVRIDAFGNIFGRRNGTDPDAAPILVGSHLDSQPYGGIYDGALGVVAGLEFIRTLDDRDMQTRHPIEIVNWTNEEGSRFQPAMQGSGVWAGVHDIETEYEKTDQDGVRLVDELERIGYRGNEPARPEEEYASYLELHIEQGPYLEANEADVGIVSGIVGFAWGEVTFSGQANHSGTTPMQHRDDALVAAADVTITVRRLAGTLGDRTVATVGSISAEPNSINVVPETVTFTWDVRDPDDDTVDTAAERIEDEIAAAAAREGVEYETKRLMRAPAVKFSDRCVSAVEQAVETLEYDGMRLVSGAGHDATHVATVCDTGMVFAVSEDGKSHTEEEYTSWSDCYMAANTLGNAALHLADPVE